MLYNKLQSYFFTGGKMHEVFISYSSKDKTYADAIIHTLEEYHIKCWIAYRDATPGLSYSESIISAIREAKIFLLIFSENSKASHHVRNEINYATKVGSVIIPFRVEEVQPDDSLEYYLGATHWLEALTKPLQNHIIRLKNSILSNLSHSEDDHIAPVTNAIDATQQDALRIVDAKYLYSKGMSPLDIALRLVENDLNLYLGITEQNEGSAEQWAEFIENCPDYFSFLINGKNEIVGDWSILALNDEMYDLAVKGLTTESELDIDSTEYICFPGNYNGYLLNMSINMEYKTLDNNLKLVDSFFSRLEKFAQNGIFFSRFCVNVFRKDQQAFYKNFGFSYVSDNKVLGKIYEISLNPYPAGPLFAKRPLLKQLYENNFQ